MEPSSEPKGTTSTPDQKPKLKESLKPGQNFYEQAPFQRIIGDVATETSTEISKLRGALTSIAELGIEKFPPGKPKQQELTPEQLSQKVNNIYDRDVINALGNVGFYRNTHPEQISAIREIVDRLKKFPLWHNYVNEQLRSYYENDGTPKPTTNTSTPTPDTYARYLSIKTKGSRTAILKGINEVFDQKAMNLAQGKPGPARRWAALKAAELTEPK